MESPKGEMEAACQGLRLGLEQDHDSDTVPEPEVPDFTFDPMQQKHTETATR